MLTNIAWFIMGMEWNMFLRHLPKESKQETQVSRSEPLHQLQNVVVLGEGTIAETGGLVWFWKMVHLLLFPKGRRFTSRWQGWIQGVAGCNLCPPQQTALPGWPCMEHSGRSEAKTENSQVTWPAMSRFKGGGGALCKGAPRHSSPLRKCVSPTF